MTKLKDLCTWDQHPETCWVCNQPILEDDDLADDWVVYVHERCDHPAIVEEKHRVILVGGDAA